MASKLKLDGTVINKCWPIRRAMVIIIILLHALITVNFAVTWSYVHTAFIVNGQCFYTVYFMLNNGAQASLEAGVAASMSAMITDLYMVHATRWELSHQLTIVSTLDLVLLDGLGTTLGRCSASNTLPNFRNW